MLMKKHRTKLKRTLFVGISAAITIPYLALMGELPANAETIKLVLTNGDTIHGTLVKTESNNDVTVIIHPSLGRLVIQESALKPKTEAKRWTASISGGITGSNSDEDLDYGGTAQISTRYKDDINLFSFNANSEYEVSRDSGEATTSTDTNQGQVDLRYSRKITGKLDVYAGSHYDYNTLNSIGINNSVNSIGCRVTKYKLRSILLNSKTVLNASKSVCWNGRITMLSIKIEAVLSSSALLPNPVLSFIPSNIGDTNNPTKLVINPARPKP